jgi:hypothetical protein
VPLFGRPTARIALDAGRPAEARIHLIHVRGESSLVAHLSPASAASPAASSCSSRQSPGSSRPARLRREDAIPPVPAVLPHPPPPRRRRGPRARVTPSSRALVPAYRGPGRLPARVGRPRKRIQPEQLLHRPWQHRGPGRSCCLPPRGTRPRPASSPVTGKTSQGNGPNVTRKCIDRQIN